eukprot:9406404-Pyramimonas_sp.AAC.1
MNIKEDLLDQYGRDQQHAEWRNKTMTFLTSQLVDQLCNRTNKDNKQVCVRVFTRADTNVHRYVQSSDGGPCWGDVVRRSIVDLDTEREIEGIE